MSDLKKIGETFFVYVVEFFGLILFVGFFFQFDMSVAEQYPGKLMFFILMYYACLTIPRVVESKTETV